MNRLKVVILGAGFGGLTAAKKLANSNLDITVVDRNNYHLFQPLLYQVATAVLSPGEISMPIRNILGKYSNARVVMGTVIGIDRNSRKVFFTGINGIESHIAFDYLIVATGARHSYFNHPEWESYAPGLKSIEDATKIRRNILLAFEKAELATDDTERQSWLTFIIVGAGPTGAELAGAISELARKTLVAEFRKINPNLTRVILIERDSRILTSFPDSLSSAAESKLKNLGVEVLKNSQVMEVNTDGIKILTQENEVKNLNARTVLWAAGVKASPVVKWLNLQGDHSGRVKVNSDLSILDDPNIFVIGDCALVEMKNGGYVPGVCPAAIQQGQYVSRKILALSKNKIFNEEFKYINKGNLATLGRSAAIADFGWLKINGFLAWALWLFVQILFLIGFKNKLFVLIQWAWAYLTFQRGTRLITHIKSN